MFQVFQGKSLIHSKIFWCLVLACLLRVPQLFESLWLDELYSTGLFLLPFDNFLQKIKFIGHPPLYSALMRTWILFFGDSEISIRILPLLCGLMAIYLTYTWTRMVFDERCANLTALLMTISPVHIWYSGEARLYSAFIVCVMLVAVCFENIKIKFNEKKAWIFYGLALFLMGSIHFYGATCLLMFGFYVLIKHRHSPWIKKHVWINFWLIIFFTVLIGAKMTFWYQDGYTSFPAHLRTFNFFEWWMLFFNWLTWGNVFWHIWPYSISWSGLTQYPVLIIGQCFVFLIWLRGITQIFMSKNTGVLYVFLIFIPLLFLVLAFIPLFEKSYIERAFLFCLPFFYVVLGKGLGRNGNARMSTKIFNTCAIGILILSMGGAVWAMYTTQSHKWTVYKPNPDWKNAAAYLDQLQKPNDHPWMVLSLVPAEGFLYYSNQIQIKFIDEQLSDIEKKEFNKSLHEALMRYEQKNLFFVNHLFWRTITFKQLKIWCELFDETYSVERVGVWKSLELYRIQKLEE